MPAEHSSRQLALDVALLGQPRLPPGLQQWELAAREGRAGSDRVDTWQACEGCLPGGGAAPVEREMGRGEVMGPLVLPSQTQLWHLKEARGTALMS